MTNMKARRIFQFVLFATRNGQLQPSFSDMISPLVGFVPALPPQAKVLFGAIGIIKRWKTVDSGGLVS